MVSKNFFDNHLGALIECVNFASDEIMQIYNSESFDQEEKSDGSPLTIADKKSNEIILNSLEKISKDISIISEETFSEDLIKSLDQTYWLVDPLDGTKEFINKTGEFTVNIAMINNKKVVFGIVGAPITGKIWHGSIFEDVQSQNDSYDKLRIVMSKSHKSDKDTAFLNYIESQNIDYEIIEKGSSLKLCSLADNEADIYPRFGPTSEWDIAAADAFLRSRGGEILKASNFTALEYGKSDSILNPYFFCFRNEPVKQKIMPILGEFNKKLL